MKNKKLSFWLLILVGLSGVISSIFFYTKGADFNNYFWSGLFGIILLGMALINTNSEKK